MANTPQAKKRIRRNNARAEINTNRVSRIRSFIKKVETAIAGGDKTAAADDAVHRMPVPNCPTEIGPFPPWTKLRHHPESQGLPGLP